MPEVQLIFAEGDLEADSNLYKSTCSLDSLPPKLVLKWVIVDYIYYRICTMGYENIELFLNERGYTVTHRVLDLIMRHLVDRAKELETTFAARFENRNALLLRTPERAQRDFMDSLNNIWVDQLANWGRFLSYITFTAAYCMKCLDAGMVLVIQTLVEYAIAELDAKMGKWVLAHGGWQGFLKALQEIKLN